MLHEPRVLFLDEPTIGLDAVAKLAVREFVKTLNRERGVTVILTTHDMQDVEALAERVIVIGKGVILADGSLSSLRRGALAERRLWVHFAGDVATVDVPGATVRQRRARSVELAFDPRVTSAHRADRARGLRVRRRGRAPRGAADRGSHRAVLRAALGRVVMGIAMGAGCARTRPCSARASTCCCSIGRRRWRDSSRSAGGARSRSWCSPHSSVGQPRSPMTIQQAIDYIWLGQALLTLLPWSADPEIARMVRSGDVAYERLRPLDTYAFWYARAVARRTATPLLRAIPMVITAGLVLRLLGMSRWGLSGPAGWDAALLFCASMVLVVALSTAVATLMDILDRRDAVGSRREHTHRAADHRVLRESGAAAAVPGLAAARTALCSRSPG